MTSPPRTGASAHIGFDVTGQDVPDQDGFHVVEGPSMRVAAYVHRGSLQHIDLVYEAFIRWILESGHAIRGRSRELYLEWDEAHPERSVTELQMPVA